MSDFMANAPNSIRGHYEAPPEAPFSNF